MVDESLLSKNRGFLLADGRSRPSRESGGLGCRDHGREELDRHEAAYGSSEESQLRFNHDQGVQIRGINVRFEQAKRSDANS